VGLGELRGGVRTWSQLLLFPPSPLGPPFCSTRRTGVGARTENGGGHLAASCLGCGGCLYGEDGGGGLAASSCGFPWVRKLRVSSEDGGGTHAISLCGFPRVRKPRVSSEDGSGARAASAGLRLPWLGLFEGVQAATTAVGFSLRRFCLS
jgi:hypothetical protein